MQNLHLQEQRSVVLALPLLALPFVITLQSAQAECAEFGVKGGYNVYSNDLSSPSTFGVGIFMNTSLSESWSLEGGALSLGEAKENNANIGAFNFAEISALYHWDLPHDQQVFAKAGVAPWFGYMTASNGGQGYEYGASPIVGVGYTFPLYDRFYGRLEYQFVPNLGGDVIGYTDSHLISLGLSWRTSHYGDESSYAATLNSPSQLDATSMKGKLPSSVAVVTPKNKVERELYGSWLFDINSSVLVVPKSFTVLDKARQLLSQGCKVSAIDVEGYADGIGGDKYNQWLSERRARKVAKYLAHALGKKSEVAVNGFGSERSSGRAEISFYERRVDFRFRFQCLREEDR
ncbi:OmpA family protein [Vibrio harveyi]